MTAMLCEVGQFHWDLEDDGECPNHGPNLRTGEDPNGVPYLGCCSRPDPLWEIDPRSGYGQKGRGV